MDFNLSLRLLRYRIADLRRVDNLLRRHKNNSNCCSKREKHFGRHMTIKVGTRNSVVLLLLDFRFYCVNGSIMICQRHVPWQTAITIVTI